MEGTAATVPRSEVFAALSLAMDLATGQPMGHGLRTCLVAIGLADRLGVDPDTAHDTYELALLRSLGCTSTAHELSRWFGDDVGAHQRLAPSGLGSTGAVLRDLVRHGPTRTAVRALTQGSRAVHDLFASSCEVAGRFGDRLGVRLPVRVGLEHVFARWDGRGWPADASGESVSLCARIVQMAHDAAVFHRIGGKDAAEEVVRNRSGAAYDPTVAGAFLASAGDLLAATERLSLWDAVLDAEPGHRSQFEGTGIDGALEAIADFADLKSPWTAGHSRAVARLAEEAGVGYGLDGAAAETVRRAALVHDVGRVGVASRVWDKPGPLDEPEWHQVRLHPHLTDRILARSESLRPLGYVAASHHERLDGSGYPHGINGATLSPEARLLAAADAFAALASDRPHRARLEPAAAARFVQAEARAGRLDREAVEAVVATASHGQPPPRPPGLTGHDVEVMRLLARGLTSKQIAGKLAMTEQGAGRQAEQLSRTLGVRSRAALVLAAAEHELFWFSD